MRYCGIPGKGTCSRRRAVLHETYQWVTESGSQGSEFHSEPKRYLDFGPCDAADQIDLPDDPLAGLDAGDAQGAASRRQDKGRANFEDIRDSCRFGVPREAPSINEPGTYRFVCFS